MAYVVHIKQIATGAVRTRQEDGEWQSDTRLWLRGSRACDCARALLFARDTEDVACPCGFSAYAIRVTAQDGREFHCEDAFANRVQIQLPVSSEHGGADIVHGGRLGALARQAFGRLGMH